MTDTAHPFDQLAEAVRAYVDAYGLEQARQVMLLDLDTAIVMEAFARPGRAA